MALLIDRYIDRCEENSNGCLIWHGATSGWGYPVANINGRGTFTYLHKYVYEQTSGIVPDGFVVDHKCNNTRCLNPDHLQTISKGLNKIKEGTAGQKSKINMGRVRWLLEQKFPRKKIAQIECVSYSAISQAMIRMELI